MTATENRTNFALFFLHLRCCASHDLFSYSSRMRCMVFATKIICVKLSSSALGEPNCVFVWWCVRTNIDNYGTFSITLEVVRYHTTVFSHSSSSFLTVFVRWVIVLRWAHTIIGEIATSFQVTILLGEMNSIHWIQNGTVFVIYHFSLHNKSDCKQKLTQSFLSACPSVRPSVHHSVAVSCLVYFPFIYFPGCIRIAINAQRNMCTIPPT